MFNSLDAPGPQYPGAEKAKKFIIENKIIFFSQH